MYLKKRVVVLISIFLVVCTALISIGLINPFGFFAYGDLLKMKMVSGMTRKMFYEDYDQSKLVDGALYGLTAGFGDPYTTYIDKETAISFRQQIQGSYAGIGAYIEKSAEDGLVTIVSPIQNTPAEKAGLMTGDKVLKVDGEVVTESDDASEKMRGPVGTDVVITVRKKNNGEITDLTITRAKIILETVSSRMINDDIAYIKVTQFSATTTDEFEKALDSLDMSKTKGLIVDLRNNGGGIIDVAVDMADMFLPRGEVVVYTVDKNGNRKDYKTKKPGIEVPMVIITNEGSASASEIFAGAMRDHSYAELIGEKTYGKGIVQVSYNLSDGSNLNITYAKYYTPNGVDIHKEGITPDVTVELPNGHAPLSQMQDKDDSQLQKAIEILKQK